jgi:hypothetical protein
MAFPGIYNISYYKGDTYEFKIYPKDASGSPFPLDGYDLTAGVTFTISSERGDGGISDQIEGYSVISTDRTHIVCAIRPENGNQLSSSVNYVYDVEISKSGTPYNIVRTLLTGSITITDQISGAIEASEGLES